MDNGEVESSDSEESEMGMEPEMVEMVLKWELNLKW
jgi:hypothetical protein